jgi:hemoglobin
MTTLFEKYGGFETIQNIVIEFYREILSRETLAPYFVNVNLDKLIDHQTRFLSHLLGGPSTYQGKTLEAAHLSSHISGAAFDEVASILCWVLEDAGVSEEDLKTILGVVGDARSAIVRDNGNASPL